MIRLLSKSNHGLTYLFKFLFLLLFVTGSVSCSAEDNQNFNTDDNQTIAPQAPLVEWDFNAGEEMFDSKPVVEWRQGARETQPVPDTNLRGVKFYFKATPLDEDSTSEVRYSIDSKSPHLFELIKVYQPTNFYHRAGIKVITEKSINPVDWAPGDKVVASAGATAIVASSSDKEILLTDFTRGYDLNWGNRKVIINTTNGSRVRSEDRVGLPSNNKLSAMWQGKYSNAGMILETQTINIAEGGVMGTSHCRPTVIARGTPKRADGRVENNLKPAQPAKCFDPESNGKVVTLVIERKRSSAFRKYDAAYRIWKAIDDDSFELIYEAEGFDVYQEGQNYFDSGYLFGWSNSGYNRDTSFYLLKWSLWDEKPYFLP